MYEQVDYSITERKPVIIPLFLVRQTTRVKKENHYFLKKSTSVWAYILDKMCNFQKLHHMQYSDVASVKTTMEDKFLKVNGPGDVSAKQT